MARWLRHKITYANVVATFALFLALGGTGYAALAVTGKNVRDGSLTGADIRDRSIKSVDIAKGVLAGGNARTQGAQGNTGAAGSNGSNGEKGDRGPAGAPGAKGSDGVPGSQGPKGDPCASSEPLCRGPKGDVGPTYMAMSDDNVPPTGPDSDVKTLNVTLPAAGRVYVSVEDVKATVACQFQPNTFSSFCNGTVGIYIDGAPVRGDTNLVANGEGGQSPQVTTDAHMSGLSASMAAGAHTITVAKKATPRDDASGVGVVQTMTVTAGNVTASLVGS